MMKWLRRAGAGHLLRNRGEVSSNVPLPRPTRLRKCLKVGQLECARCHQVVERRSPVQRYCPACAADLGRARSRKAMAVQRRKL
jgi:hypothetical protein